jgi:hypothetical protein
MHEQPVENRVDVLGAAEHPLEPRAAASRAHDGEIARPGVAEAFAVEHERNAGNEVRLADDELAALLDLDDGAVGQLDLEEAANRQA